MADIHRKVLRVTVCESKIESKHCLLTRWPTLYGVEFFAVIDLCGRPSAQSNVSLSGQRMRCCCLS